MKKEKEFIKYLNTMKGSNEKGYISLTYYSKGNNNNWYCELYYYDGNEYFTFTKKATGYGYDKESTCVSNCLNLFKDVFKRYGKRAKKYTYYGLYDDNTISYGIGIKCVVRCMECFKNVKFVSHYEGINESCLKYEIIL